MKIGNTFKTREGKQVTVIEFCSDETHPVVCIDHKKRLQKYTKDGKFISNTVQHKMDLVEQL
jgi:predicted transcriptional regulator